jgi:hypothetical protein
MSQKTLQQAITALADELGSAELSAVIGTLQLTQKN